MNVYWTSKITFLLVVYYFNIFNILLFVFHKRLSLSLCCVKYVFPLFVCMTKKNYIAKSQ